MGQQVGGGGHRPGQHLLQVAHSGEQAPRICEFPAPPCVLGKGKCQAARITTVALPRPEDGAERTDWLPGIGMDAPHPVVVRPLEPGTGGGLRECRGWHHPDRVKSGIQRYCSKRPGSLTLVVSWSERSTCFPCPASRATSSLSIRIPI